MTVKCMQTLTKLILNAKRSQHILSQKAAMLCNKHNQVMLVPLNNCITFYVNDMIG